MAKENTINRAGSGQTAMLYLSSWKMASGTNGIQANATKHSGDKLFMPFANYPKTFRHKDIKQLQFVSIKSTAVTKEKKSIHIHVYTHTHTADFAYQHLFNIKS